MPLAKLGQYLPRRRIVLRLIAFSALDGANGEASSLAFLSDAADVTVGTALCDAANVLGEVVWMGGSGAERLRYSIRNWTCNRLGQLAIA